MSVDMKHGHGRENIQRGGVAPLRPSQSTTSFPSPVNLLSASAKSSLLAELWVNKQILL